MKLFEEWVYNILRKQGNVSINPKWVNLFGCERICNDIKQHGFNNVEIDLHYHDPYIDRYVIDPKKYKEESRYCIISVY